jgi:hypothetical protein
MARYSGHPSFEVVIAEVRFNSGPWRPAPIHLPPPRAIVEKVLRGSSIAFRSQVTRGFCESRLPVQCVDGLEGVVPTQKTSTTLIRFEVEPPEVVLDKLAGRKPHMDTLATKAATITSPAILTARGRSSVKATAARNRVRPKRLNPAK